MTDNQKHSFPWFKTIAISLLCVLGVFIAGVWLINSEWLYDKIEEKIEETASEVLEAEVELNDLKGDIFSYLILDGITWKKAENEVSIKEIKIEYTLKEILFGDVNIRGIYVDSVLAKFQNPKSEELIPQSEEESEYTFVIDIFSISDLRTEYQDDEYFKDTALVVDDFQLASSLTIGETNSVTINDVSFAIESGKLPGDLLVELQGVLDDDTIKLNDIILTLGNTILNGHVDANLKNESLNSKISGTPVYQQTIADWTNKQLNADDIDLQLSLTGSFSEFDVTINVESDNIQQGVLKAHLLSDPIWTLKKIDVSAAYLNADQVIDDSTYASVGPVSFRWEGTIQPTEKKYSGKWNSEFSKPRWNEYAIERVRWEGAIDDDEVKSTLRVTTPGKEQLFAEAEIKELFAEVPNWAIDYELVNINPKNWTEDSDLDGSFTFSGNVNGFGWAFPDSGWSYSLINRRLNDNKRVPIQIYNENIDLLKLNGEIGKLKTIANLDIEQKGNVVTGDFHAINLFGEIPQYSYYLEFEEIDLGKLKQLEGNTTSINGNFYGIGNGKTIENTHLFGTLSITDSEINGAKLDTFKGAINLNDGLLVIKEGTIESEILAGSIRGQRNIFDISDPDNSLNLNLELLNTQPLAGFFGLTTLEATGNVTGEITEVPNEGLEGSFNLSLNSIHIDSLFEAVSVSGDATLGLGENIDFDAGLSIEQPRIEGVVLQDIILGVTGQTNTEFLTADLDVTITGSERGRLVQKAAISKDLSTQITDVKFTQFDFITTEADLILQKPFNIRLSKSGFGTDTMVLLSDNGAFLEFSLPYVSESDKEIILSGSNFDIGLIQEIVLGNRYLDGHLSGDIKYQQQGGASIGKGHAIISDINYKGTLADSLVAAFNIRNERLQIESSLSWDNQQMITGSVNVPFVIDIENFSETFFNRSVEGSLTVKPTNLVRFKKILTDAGIENTTGVISFESSMSGTAGSPIFSGQLTINEPVLSGIPINSITSEFNYSAERQTLDVKSEIFAVNTTAAEVTIAYPFEIDFRTYKFKLPGADDQLDIKAVSNNLNLALFNDFLDPNYVKSLKGELNANLEFNGPVGKIRPKGFFSLRNGSFDVPYSGVKLRNINAQINVDPQRLNVVRIQAESGRGRFTASGSAALDGLTPSNINIKTDARLFEISNTRDMKLVIDLDATMKGELLQPELSGKLIVNSGYYYLTNFGEEAIEEIDLEDEGIDSFAPFDSLAIDMSLEFRRDFFVRSRDYLDLQLEPIGTLEVAKERNEDIRLFGSLNADQGYIRPLGKRFEIERGTFQFIGDYDNPELDIRSAYVPQTRQKGESVILYYVVTGTAENPEFSFESEPEMEQSDVICYTLFNKPCYSLDSWQSVLAEGNDAMAFQALADVLLDQVETLATRELGVDVVQIDNSGQNGATAIRTGWYLNERTFFAIINEITSSTPKTLFVLEYILNESWDLIITQGDDARQGIDVRYQYDY